MSSKAKNLKKLGVKESYIRLLDALQTKDWTTANRVVNKILQRKVNARLMEERKTVMREDATCAKCDGTKGRHDKMCPTLDKGVKGGRQLDTEDVDDAKDIKEGYYRVTYMDGRSEKTLTFQGSASDARGKVKAETGKGREIVDVETISAKEMSESRRLQEEIESYECAKCKHEWDATRGKKDDSVCPKCGNTAHNRQMIGWD